jgi:hypothetical protein
MMRLCSMIFFKGSDAPEPPGLILSAAQAARQQAARTEIVRLARETVGLFLTRQGLRG